MLRRPNLKTLLVVKIIVLMSFGVSSAYGCSDHETADLNESSELSISKEPSISLVSTDAKKLEKESDESVEKIREELKKLDGLVTDYARSKSESTKESIETTIANIGDSLEKLGHDGSKAASDVDEKIKKDFEQLKSQLPPLMAKLGHKTKQIINEGLSGFSRILQSLNESIKKHKDGVEGSQKGQDSNDDKLDETRT